MIDKFIGAISNKNRARLNISTCRSVVQIIANEDLRLETFNLARFSLQIVPINLSITHIVIHTFSHAILTFAPERPLGPVSPGSPGSPCFPGAPFAPLKPRWPVKPCIMKKMKKDKILKNEQESLRNGQHLQSYGRTEKVNHHSLLDQ